MEKQKFNEVQMTVLKLLEKDLFGTDYLPDANTDWQAVFKESRQQAIPLHIYNALENAIPQEMVEKWEENAVNNLQKNIMVHTGHSVIHELLTKNELPYCILKGCSSTYYYPDFCLRTMGDVDFLIRNEDKETVIQILEEAGFTMKENDRVHHHIAFKKGGVLFEMHLRPVGIPDGKAGELVRDYLSDIFEETELIQKESAVFRKPSDFHHGLIILMHTYNHLIGEGVGLRHLSDLAVFFHHFSDEEFRDIFYEKLSNLGLWKFAQIMACVSHQYLGLPYRAWMGDVDEKLCADVMQDIYDGGNFGRKDEKRADQAILISNRGKEGVKNSSFIQLCFALNKAAKTGFPGLYKMKILRPLAWIIVCIRFGVNLLTGKRRKINVNHLIFEAEKRKAIYRQFRLFETEEK